jgi:hypothetical protein
MISKAKNTTMLCVLLIAFASCTNAQVATRAGGATKLNVEEVSGGSNITKLSYGIALNKGSSLQRRWFVVNDPSCPMTLTKAGINTGYESNSIGGDYNYVAAGAGSFSEKITAYEVRYLLFDVWGAHMQTLAAQDVSDRDQPVDLKASGTWRAWNENDVAQMLTVVSFVSRVRKADGTIWEYDPHALLQEVEKIKVKLTDKELAPEKEKPRS